MLKKYYGLSLLLISTVACADFCPCPSSFNLIQIGNSLDQILKTCCAPTARNTYQKAMPVPQKWSYNITAPANPVNSVQGSVELIVTFDETEKVTNISVNAQSLTTTNCGNSPTTSFAVNTPNSIQIGSSMEEVKTACGTAKFVQRGEPQTNNQTAPIITELQYSGPPPVTLKFVNGSLTEINKGVVVSPTLPAKEMQAQ